MLAGYACLFDFLHDFAVGASGSVHIEYHTHYGRFSLVDDITSVLDVITQRRYAATEKTALGADGFTFDTLLPGLKDIELPYGSLHGFVEEICGLVEIANGGSDGI
ncbi:MAG: hypothetical protein PHI27_06735 [Eubacteriales bacterium]|nr:hypothetical protein [Eubacteriales bacterium]MDD4513769.1 hypothetical protein [Eubacteriales bacterium]